MILQQIYGGNYQISLESPKFYRRPYKNILHLFFQTVYNGVGTTKQVPEL